MPRVQDMTPDTRRTPRIVCVRYIAVDNWRARVHGSPVPNSIHSVHHSDSHRPISLRVERVGIGEIRCPQNDCGDLADLSSSFDLFGLSSFHAISSVFGVQIKNPQNRASHNHDDRAYTPHLSQWAECPVRVGVCLSYPSCPSCPFV